MDTPATTKNDLDNPLESFPKKFLRIFGWIAAILLIFGLLLSSSWYSLLTMAELPNEDTRSKFSADYNPWVYIAFQPVDQAIIQAIENDRADGVDLENPEEVEEEGWFWETPTPEPEDEGQGGGFTPEATSTFSATATKVAATAIATNEPTSTPTSTATPTSTPSPSATSTFPPPTATTVPTKTPKPPSRTPFPTFILPTITPTPPLNCSLVTLRDQSTNTNKSRWIIQNKNGGLIVTVDSLTITWPAENGNLTKVSLGSNIIWTGSAAPTSLTINSSDWTGGPLTIPGNAILIFQFENNVENSGYAVTINFVEGCVVNDTR